MRSYDEPAVNQAAVEESGRRKRRLTSMMDERSDMACEYMSLTGATGE